MGEAQRKTYAASFKAKVGLEAIRGVKTANEIAQDYGVHPVQVGQWQQAITAQAGTLFETKRGRKTAEDNPDADRLYREIGRLKVERDWLKKPSTGARPAPVGTETGLGYTRRVAESRGR